MRIFKAVPRHADRHEIETAMASAKDSITGLAAKQLSAWCRLRRAQYPADVDIGIDMATATAIVIHIHIQKKKMTMTIIIIIIMIITYIYNN